MMSSQIFTQLDNLHLQLANLLSRLASLLQDERQSLAHQDMATLDAVISSKQQLTSEITQLEQQRAGLLQQAGYENSRTGMEKLCLQATPALPEFSDNWHATQQLIRQCADSNQVNGIVMTHHRQNIETRLKILRGQPLSPDSYNHNGKTPSDTGTRSLAHV